MIPPYENFTRFSADFTLPGKSQKGYNKSYIQEKFCKSLLLVKNFSKKFFEMLICDQFVTWIGYNRIIG